VQAEHLDPDAAGAPAGVVAAQGQAGLEQIHAAGQGAAGRRIRGEVLAGVGQAAAGGEAAGGAGGQGQAAGDFGGVEALLGELEDLLPHGHGGGGGHKMDSRRGGQPLWRDPARRSKENHNGCRPERAVRPARRAANLCGAIRQNRAANLCGA
jgi:hypothetical protein